MLTFVGPGNAVIPALAAQAAPDALPGANPDDDEILIQHTLALRQGLHRAHLGVVPGAGHGLPVDKPEFFNRLIMEFLAEETDGGNR
jgi:pimeloyl-ACP methyl ester carboxylesterase